MDGTPRLIKTLGRGVDRQPRVLHTRCCVLQSLSMSVIQDTWRAEQMGAVPLATDMKGQVQLRGATTHIFLVAPCIMDVESAVNTSQLLEDVCRTMGALHIYRCILWYASSTKIVHHVLKQIIPSRGLLCGAPGRRCCAFDEQLPFYTLESQQWAGPCSRGYHVATADAVVVHVAKLFDAALSVFYCKLLRGWHRCALRYLQTSVVQGVPLGIVRKVPRIAQSAWGCTARCLWPLE